MIRRWLVAVALRARHNDHDAACVLWHGDRRPDADDRANRLFTGEQVGVMERRCLVCRPHPDADRSWWRASSTVTP